MGWSRPSNPNYYPLIYTPRLIYHSGGNPGMLLITNNGDGDNISIYIEPAFTALLILCRYYAM